MAQALTWDREPIMPKSLLCAKSRPVLTMYRWSSWVSGRKTSVTSKPDVGSPILTRELLYTAVTRAKQRVTVVGSEAAIREAVARPVARASGLRERLWGID